MTSSARKPASDAAEVALAGPVELFERWELQQWRVGDLDFEREAGVWAGLGPFTTGELTAALVQFLLGESAVTDTLTPLIDGAPTPEARLFLCTQLVDEARHTLFFDRYLAAVAIEPGDLRDRWEESPGLAALMDVELRRVTGAVREDATRREAFYEAVVIYHLIVEGVLALSGQRAILGALERLGGLEVLATGLESIARDEARHLAFGVATLRSGLREGHGDAILARTLACVPLATAALVAPERRLPTALPARAREAWGRALAERWQTDLAGLVGRLRLVGFGAREVGEVEATWHEAIAASVDRYGQLHGIPHPLSGPVGAPVGQEVA